MKTQLTFYFLFSFQLIFSQETYTSPFSEHFPSGLVETFERVIKINEEDITIETKVDSLTNDLQVLVVKSYQVNEQDLENHRVFICSSPNGEFPSKVIIPKHREYILVMQPSRIVPGELEAFRLLLDTNENNEK